MDLKDIKEIGLLHNVKVQNSCNNEIEKRDLIMFVFNNNDIQYLDIEAGIPLEKHEKVLVNDKTKVEKIFKNRNENLEVFKANHPNLDIKLEDGVLKAKKKNKE